MKYLLMIYANEAAEAAMTPDQLGALLQRYGAYTKELVEAGAMVAGEALRETATARSVRVREGQSLVTDGPFAETREQLGGFYLIEAGSMEEALEWAAKIPSAEVGTIEVRPIMDYGSMVE